MYFRILHKINDALPLRQSNQINYCFNYNLLGRAIFGPKHSPKSLFYVRMRSQSFIILDERFIPCTHASNPSYNPHAAAVAISSGGDPGPSPLPQHRIYVPLGYREADA